MADNDDSKLLFFVVTGVFALLIVIIIGALIGLYMQVQKISNAQRKSTGVSESMTKKPTKPDDELAKRYATSAEDEIHFVGDSIPSRSAFNNPLKTGASKGNVNARGSPNYPDKHSDPYGLAENRRFGEGPAPNQQLGGRFGTAPPDNQPFGGRSTGPANNRPFAGRFGTAPPENQQFGGRFGAAPPENQSFGGRGPADNQPFGRFGTGPPQNQQFGGRFGAGPSDKRHAGGRDDLYY